MKFCEMVNKITDRFPIDNKKVLKICIESKKAFKSVYNVKLW